MGFAIYDAAFGKSTDYAKEAQKAEDKRQAAILKGTGQVDQAFAGFNQPFYDARRQAYIDYALPQLSDQYQTTRNQVGFGLANRGQTNSSTANKQWSDLFRTTEASKRGIADAATAQSQDLQKQIAGSRQNLINQLYTTADPANASQSAISTAAGFQTPSTFAPLVNQFSGLLNQYYISQLLNQRQPATAPIGTGSGAGYGSSFAPLPGVTQDSYLPG